MSGRLARVADAVRPEMKARLLLSGPAGAGKTYTALTVASVLTNGAMPLVIDTEEESALTYADQFRFKHLPWDPPYNPQELAEVVEQAAKEHPAVVIDSASHFWNEEGGTLEIANGKFTGWKAARPAQRDFIHAILRARTHIVVCVRSKMDYVQVEENGKQVVKKLGMAPIQDSTIDYEVNVAAELDYTHALHISKTRCAALADRTFSPGHASDLAGIYRDWLRGGEPLAAPELVDDIKHRLNALPGEARRAYRQQFGHPDHLVERQAKAADEFVRNLESVPSTVSGKEDAGEHEGDSETVGGGEPPPITDGGGAPSTYRQPGMASGRRSR